MYLVVSSLLSELLKVLAFVFNVVGHYTTVKYNVYINYTAKEKYTSCVCALEDMIVCCSFSVRVLVCSCCDLLLIGMVKSHAMG